MELLPISKHVLLRKYCHAGESTLEQVVDRVTRGYEQSGVIRDLILSHRFMPGGRILSNHGSKRTSLNCFVLPIVADSIEGIMDTLRMATQIQTQGGGVGYNFTPIRPRGTKTSTDCIAGGPCSYISIFSETLKRVIGVNQRTAANIAILNVDHPDILEFIRYKADHKNEWQNFNVSVGITNEFMRAKERNEAWTLKHPCEFAATSTISARDLWMEIMKAQHEYGDPGVFFLDTVNQEYNLGHKLRIDAPNPCGEEPFPAFTACCLGAINLATHVNSNDPDEALRFTTREAVKYLNWVLDTTVYPIPETEHMAKNARVIGLGTTGLADALALCGIPYGVSAKSLTFIDRYFSTIRDAAYATSCEMARMFHPFALWDDEILERPFIKRLPHALQSQIAAHGLFNSQLLCQAPTGSISLLMNNTSGGIEPHFDLKVVRREKTSGEHELEYPHLAHINPEIIVTSKSLAPADHLAIQARIQLYTDGAVSKTVNLPSTATVDDIAMLYSLAHAQNLKGLTIYRDQSRADQVVRNAEAKPQKREGVYKMTGYEVPSPSGKLYLSITEDLQQVFIRGGKSGSDPNHFVEVIGRLISIALQEGADLARVVKTLMEVNSGNGLWGLIPGCDKSVFIASVADAIGKTLYYNHTAEGKKVVGALTSHGQLGTCPMCGVQALVHAEGCERCLHCSHSRCD